MHIDHPLPELPPTSWQRIRYWLGRARPQAAALAALGFLVLSAERFKPRPYNAEGDVLLDDAVFFMVIGVLLLWLAILFSRRMGSRRHQPASRPSSVVEPPAARDLTRRDAALFFGVLVGCVLLLVLLPREVTGPVLLLISGASLLLGLGLTGWQRLQRRRAAGTRASLRARWRSLLTRLRTRQPPRVPPPWPAMTRAHRRALLAGILALALVTEANAQLLGDRLAFLQLQAMHHHVQFVLFCLGVILVTWGLSAAPAPPRDPRRWPPLRGPNARDAVMVMVMLLAALVLHLWNLEHSVRVPVDELQLTSQITGFWGSENSYLLRPENWQAPYARFYMYWQSWSVALFGRGFTGIRAVSALLGALHLPLVYLLGRWLFTRQIGLLAAFFLLIMPPHIHFSRVGLIHGGDTLFGLVALAFLVRGLRHQQRRDYALAGLGLGLSQYFFEGGRLFFPVLVGAYLGLGLLLWRNHPQTGFGRREIGLLALVALIVAAPLYITFRSEDQVFAARLSRSGLPMEDVRAAINTGTLPDLLREQVGNAFYHYVHKPESQPAFYGGEHPLLLWYVVPLFLVGLAFLAWEWAGPRVLPLLWIMGTVAGTSIMQDVLTPRYVLSFPAVALVMAVGVVGFGRLLWTPQADALAAGWRQPARLVIRSVLRIGLAGLLVFLMVGQVGYYFGAHLDYFNRQIRWRAPMDAFDAVLRAAAFPPGTQVHIIGQDVATQIEVQQFAGFLMDHIRPEDIHTLQEEGVSAKYLQSLPQDVDHAFFLAPGDTRARDRIAQYFPLSPPQYTPYNVPSTYQMVLYYYSASLTDAVGG